MHNRNAIHHSWISEGFIYSYEFKNNPSGVHSAPISLTPNPYNSAHQNVCVTLPPSSCIVSTPCSIGSAPSSWIRRSWMGSDSTPWTFSFVARSEGLSVGLAVDSFSLLPWLCSCVWLLFADDKAGVQEFEEEMADYNGDDENEPEFEADKQAELAGVEHTWTPTPTLCQVTGVNPPFGSCWTQWF